MNIAIINYGSSNIHSALKSFEAAASDFKNVSIKLTSSYKEVLSADKIVLPGVGSFAFCKLSLLENKDVHKYQEIQNPPIAQTSVHEFNCFFFHRTFEMEAREVVHWICTVKGCRIPAISRYSMVRIRFVRISLICCGSKFFSRASCKNKLSFTCTSGWVIFGLLSPTMFTRYEE